MANGNMCLLDPRGDPARHTQAMVTKLTHPATGLSRQPKSHDTRVSRSFQGLQYIRAIARRGNAQKNVPAQPVGFYLATKQLVVTKVVSDGREY